MSNEHVKLLLRNVSDFGQMLPRKQNLQTDKALSNGILMANPIEANNLNVLEDLFSYWKDH